MTKVFHVWSYGSFIEIHSNLRRKKLYRMNHGPNFLGDNFSNRDNVRASIQFRRESQPQHLKIWFFFKNRPISIPTSAASVLLDLQTKPVEFFQHWNKQVKVDLTTLVQQVLEEEYGVFCKLGFEINITKNLS